MLTLLDYSADLKDALRIAQAIAREYRSDRYGPAHLLKAVLHNDIGLTSLLQSAGIDIHYLREWADLRIRKYPKSAQVTTDPRPDDEATRTLEVADVVRLKLSLDQVNAFCVLTALTKPKAGFTGEQLKSLPLTEDQLLQLFLEQPAAAAPATGPAQTNGSRTAPDGKATALARFCHNKTVAAREGKIDPIIGRDREIRKVAEILGRRTKPNVIIVGEPGVGKTALVEGFALRIVAEEVPDRLRDADVFELDVGSLIAGASYKGEIEERLKSIIREVKAQPKAILFIDEIHVLLDERAGAAGSANLLKPELARGELTVIGATTFEEYRKYIEKDDAFRRRFDVVDVREPDEERAVRMLRALAPKYSEHHDIELTEGALREAVRLAMRYLKDRQLPDSAIDLVDRTLAAVRMLRDTSVDDLERLDARFSELTEELATADERTRLEEWRWFESQIRDRVSPILLGKVTDLREVKNLEDDAELQNYVRQLLDELRGFPVDKEQIESEDIAAMVAYAKGIPIGKIQADEREKLENMADYLRRRVIGQDHALHSVANAISVSRAGVSDSGRPVGSFFFLGPTGTGKTELAKTLAEFLFNDERALIRFDMSEFTEKHAAELLTGAPPGYVGYEEGGALVNQIRQQPYSVVLFDEIEKAHEDVFKKFLQILDDGKLTDKQGKVGDFTNSIILFTSNIGSQYIVEKFGEGEIPAQEELVGHMSKHFKDEFLGRLTEIVPFAPISEENIVKIFEIQLKRLHRNLAAKKITLELSEAATSHLAMKGFSPRFGARPLRRVILNDLQKPLAKRIIAGAVVAGDTVAVALENDEITWTTSNNKNE